MLERFEFSFRDTPEEAEAKYALLQKENVVDAIPSENLDTAHLWFHTVVDVESTNLDRPLISHNF